MTINLHCMLLTVIDNGTVVLGFMLVTRVRSWFLDTEIDSSIHHCNNMLSLSKTQVPFLRRAHSPDRRLQDLNQLPMDYKTRVLTNAPPGNITNVQDIDGNEYYKFIS